MEGKLHLEVDDSVSPAVMPPRRVPVALKGKLKEEIDCVIDGGVLTKLEEWVSSAFVKAKSNGKVCINSRPLKEALH